MAGLPAWPQGAGTPPRAKHFDEYAWADYVELLCLADPDGVKTPPDVVDVVRPNVEDIGGAEAVSNDFQNVDGTMHAGEADDEWEHRVEQWFDHFAYRAKAFGKAYPFEFEPVNADGAGPVLRRKDAGDNDLAPAVQLYLTLLFAANLRYCRAETSGLTRGFERLCYWALKQQLGPSAEVHLFGVGPPGGDPDEPRYMGGTYEKLEQLGRDVRAELLAEREEWPPTSAGDAGIDLVGWFPFNDEAPTMLAVFAQCAATENWDTKQFSSHSAKWAPHFRFFALPVNFVYVPLCFRRTTGDLHTKKDIGRSVFVDRVRLIHLLAEVPEYQADAVLAQAMGLAERRASPFD